MTLVAIAGRDQQTRVVSVVSVVSASDSLKALQLYSPWEERVDSWSALQDWVNQVTDRYPQLRLVWRGARRADWGLTTSLYRALQDVTKSPPTEDELVEAERNTLALARSQWRFDHMPALELFAHLQHLGGPTRLLDVSANPLIASWFAVERDEEDDDADGRLFAFSVERDIRLDPPYNGRAPRWHLYTSDEIRREHRWGTGDGRRLWRPPAYNARISAQNSAFIVDGVPLPNATPPRMLAGEETKWNIDELREVSSFNLRPSSLYGTSSRAPVFTARLSRESKMDIRRHIEDRYGYSAASLYSDLGGLASYVARRPDLLLDPTRT